MTGLEQQLSDAAIVVAHPDDEILWFSSVLHRVQKALVCYLDVPGQPGWTAGRKAVAECYPMDTVEFLGLRESVSFRGADWCDPVETEAGLELRARPGVLKGFDPALYEENYSSLKAMLETRLQGVPTVLTHNPWGEYGNEEHVQVFRAVSALQPKLGYDVWYTTYCSDRAYALMLRHISGRRSDYQALATQPERVAPIEALYRQYDCWTWPFDDYRYFAQDCFVKSVGAQEEERGATVPINFINVDAGRQLIRGETRLPRGGLVRSAYRRLRRKVL